MRDFWLGKSIGAIHYHFGVGWRAWRDELKGLPGYGLYTEDGYLVNLHSVPCDAKAPAVFAIGQRKTFDLPVI